MEFKEQNQMAFGITGVLFIIGVALTLHFTGVLSRGSEPSESAFEEEAERTGDVTPAIRSNLFPTGALSFGTTKTKISVSTNEPAYCRYSTKSGKSYDDMKMRFSYDKDKTFHSSQVKSLKNGITYEYFVRCRDTSGNKNIDDASIQFSIGGAAVSSGSYVPQTGPDQIPPIRSNLFPTGTLPASTRESQISVSTNEPAYCRYSTKFDQSYDSMQARFSYSKDKLLHTAKARGLTDNKIYEYFVRCRDLSGNSNTEDSVIRFGVGGTVFPSQIFPTPTGPDITPPYRLNPLPEEVPAGARVTNISLETDEKANCRYSLTSGMSYDSMERVFSNTDSISHSTEVFGLYEGKEYKYYIKCIDESGNKNTNDFVISFEVEKYDDYTPPERQHPYPSGDVLPAGSVSHTMSIVTNEPAYCRYDAEQGTSYKSMRKTFSRNEEKTFHTYIIKSLEGGKAYEFFVRCQDLAKNTNTDDVMISFRVATP